VNTEALRDLGLTEAAFLSKLSQAVPDALLVDRRLVLA